VKSFLSILMVVLGFSHVAGQYDKNVLEKLKAGMETVSLENSPKRPDLANDLEKLAIDLGPAVVPELQKLFSANKDKRIPGHLLAILGGENVVDFLWDAYKKGHPELAPSLCLAMSSVRDEKDISFLLELLEQERRGQIPVQVIFSLGLLKDKSAIPQLKLISKETDSLEGFAAKNAWDWIIGNAIFIDSGAVQGINREIVTALVDAGIPVADSYSIDASEDHGFWKQEKDSWIFKKRIDQSVTQILKISFRIHISPDKNRAWVLVDVYYGTVPQNYIYILQRNKDFWKVTGMMVQ
jgi:hypothetical protein